MMQILDSGLTRVSHLKLTPPLIHHWKRRNLRSAIQATHLRIRILPLTILILGYCDGQISKEMSYIDGISLSTEEFLYRFQAKHD